jgi:regulator of sigma E protease
MEFWIKAGQLILSLSILVVLHEFGHFLPARWFKTRVEKFYLFFNPGFSLFKKKIGETEWGVGWLPLGGYVKIAGMIDESMDTKQLEKPAEPWEFRSKPAWQRLIIMTGGVIVNLIVGFLIYMMVLWVWGREFIPVETTHAHGVHVNEVLKKYGLQDGDIIVSAGGKPVESLQEVNLGILVRGVRDLEVQHADGTKAEIQLNDDVDYSLFGSEGMFAFTPRVGTIVDSLLADSPAAKAGLKVGDSIYAVNGAEVPYWEDFAKTLQSKKDEEIMLSLYRSGEVLELAVRTDTNGRIGFVRQPKVDTKKVTYTVGEAVSSGFSFGYWTLRDYVSQMKFLFTSKGASNLGGFGAIGNMFAPTWDWHRFWMNTAFISIVLAFMNILPIPALDGGHVVFLLYEMVTGREPNKKVLEYAQMVGIILLLGLLLYANGNDLFKWAFK